MAYLVLLLPLCAGCCYTYWHSVPVQCFNGPRYYDAPRSAQEPINFVCLRQDPPPVYQLGPRDVLGIYIEGVLGKEGEPPPVHFPEEASIPPAIGFPIPVREDGTVSLPLVPPMSVEGLTLAPNGIIGLARAEWDFTVQHEVRGPGRLRGPTDDYPSRECDVAPR